MYQSVTHNPGTCMHRLMAENIWKYSLFSTTVNHNKAAGFERRLELYLVENFKHAFDMERFAMRLWSTPCSLTPSSYVYYTQIMQAEALAAAYRLWRRDWAGPGKEYTAGALVWQVGASRTHYRPENFII
jgi:beta-mannosidase